MNDIELNTFMFKLMVPDAAGHAGTIYEVLPLLEKHFKDDDAKNYQTFLQTLVKFLQGHKNKTDQSSGPSIWIAYKYYSGQDISTFITNVLDQSNWEAMYKRINEHR